VVSATGACTLDGFTITAGNASQVLADYGGGLVAQNANIVVRNCRFTGNAAAQQGGGAYFNGGLPLIEDSLFIGNTAGDGGGGLSMSGDGVVSRCTIADNTTDNDGAGVSLGLGAPVVQNSIFYHNVAADFSGGLSVGAGVTGAKVFNNTFYDNHGPHGGGGFSINTDGATAANNVVLDNTGKYGPNILLFDGKYGLIHHNCGNGGMMGTDNIDADPRLIAPGSQDFRLQAGSPCIDQADDALAPSRDMTGASRVDVPVIGVSVSDMGALEYQP
jgi:predicted outer membrane repeat protein